MALGETSSKKKIVAEYRIAANDTGSPEVQVALLTERINKQSQHAAQNKNDVSMRRGMMRAIAARTKLLSYLKSESPERYQKLIQKLGLRK